MLSLLPRHLPVAVFLCIFLPLTIVIEVHTLKRSAVEDQENKFGEKNNVKIKIDYEVIIFKKYSHPLKCARFSS